MPKEGYKTITIKEVVFAELKKFADERYLTMPKAVEFLINKGAHHCTSSAKEGSES